MSAFFFKIEQFQIMKTIIFSVLVLIAFLMLTGCNTPIASEDPIEKEVKNQNFEWIKLDVPYVFVSRLFHLHKIQVHSLLE